MSREKVRNGQWLKGVKEKAEPRMAQANQCFEENMSAPFSGLKNK
jgi:hypothetical protein